MPITHPPRVPHTDLLFLVVSLGAESGFKPHLIRSYVQCIPSFLEAFFRAESAEACEAISQKHLQLSVQAFACSVKVADVLIHARAGPRLLDAILSVARKGMRPRTEHHAPAPPLHGIERLADYVCNHTDPVHYATPVYAHTCSHMLTHALSHTHLACSLCGGRCVCGVRCGCGCMGVNVGASGCVGPLWMSHKLTLL